MTTSPDPLLPESPEEEIDPEYAPKRLAWQTLFGLLTFFAGVGAVLYFFKPEVLALGEALVQYAGGPGLALIWTVLDLSPIPVIPNDVFSTLAVAGGMSIWSVSAWCTVGSIIGGLLGRKLSKAVGHRPFIVRIVTQGKSAKLFNLIRRHQVLALGIGALTPVPYSLTCWGAGLTDMPLRPFLLVSLLRFPRILVYLLLFQAGMISAA